MDEAADHGDAAARRRAEAEDSNNKPWNLFGERREYWFDEMEWPDVDERFHFCSLRDYFGFSIALLVGTNPMLEHVVPSVLANARLTGRLIRLPRAVNTRMRFYADHGTGCTFYALMSRGRVRMTNVSHVLTLNAVAHWVRRWRRGMTILRRCRGKREYVEAYIFPNIQHLFSEALVQHICSFLALRSCRDSALPP